MNNNDFLLLLAAVIQQQQQQQQQQLQDQLQVQLQEQQQQVWAAAMAAAAAAAASGGSPTLLQQQQEFSNASQQQQQQQLQQQLQQQFSNASQQHLSNSNNIVVVGGGGGGGNGGHQCPSSSLLAKLNAVTSRPQAHLLTHRLDNKMIDLLEAFYAINDNPEMGAIEMISKRINVPCDLIADWFDKKRMEVNPFAGPRSPPINKKREGGRVVTFSEYQRSLLEGIFNENNYLHPQEYEELSKLIQVPSRNIKIWFKNRRSKQRLSGGSNK